MLCQLLQHVVQEADARVDIAHARPIQAQRARNRRLLCVSLQSCRPFCHLFRKYHYASLENEQPGRSANAGDPPQTP